MSFLKLSPGRKVKIALTFETPEDEYIALSDSNEARVAIAASMMSGDVTDELVDEQMGLKTQAMAQLSVITKHAMGQDTTVFMTRDELRRHVHESMAALKAMDDFARVVDVHMSKYRDGVRKKSREET